ncbi:MAG TPA: hypothetical protein VKC57_06740, partial [Ktedonobacterales bacterium]|nr:hypothetical protein [Ktedonobacterales bacterium]
MLDGLVFRHLFVDLLRLALALLIVASLRPIGALVRLLWRERGGFLFDIGVGFGVVAALLRCLAALGFAHRAGVLTVMAVVLVASIPRARALLSARRTPESVEIEAYGEVRESRRWWLALGIAVPALMMALTPPVSFDELAYHLRLPEVALQTGGWPLDLANSATFYPSATEAIYLPALALDPSGVTAKLIHFLFFLLLLTAVGRIVKRLSSPTQSSTGPPL